MNESLPSGIEVPSVRNATQSRYMVWMAPGLVGSMMAYYLYPPIIGDARLRPFWLMGLFVLALALPRIWNIARKRPSDDMNFPAAFAFSSLAYALIALFFLLNGALDRFPPAEIRTTVIQKEVTVVKGTKYHVIVSSWRPNEPEEDFTVEPDVFHRAIVGKTVTVEQHKGFWGVPWSGNILPE